MGVLDFRRFLPGVLPPDGGFMNVPTSGPGTFSVPVGADGTPQQDPPPVDPPTAPPVGTPKVPEINLTPPGVPPDPRTVPIPTSSKVPEVLTKTPGTPDERLVPTAASTAAQTGNIWDEWMKRVKDPKFGPAIAALAKGMGSGAKAPEAHQAPFPRLDPAPNISGQLGGIASQAGQSMGEIRKGLKVFGPKPKKARTDDPHDREQETYDWRRARGRG